MCCLLGLFGLIAPRLTIILLVIFTGYIGSAFDNVLWPILGFFFLPTATLAYAWAMHTTGELSGWTLVVFVIAVLIDMGAHGRASRGRRRRR
jgi:hypothetical protein